MARKTQSWICLSRQQDRREKKTPSIRWSVGLTMQMYMAFDSSE